MRKLIFALSLILILGCSLPVFAEKIDWQMVKVQTLKNSPSVREAKLILDIARQTHKVGFLDSYLPIVKLTSKDIQWSSKKDSQISKDGVTPAYDIGATLTLSLNPADYYEKIKNSCITLKIAELNYKQSVSEAIFNSNKLYLDLVAANEEVEMAKKTVEKCTENEILITLKCRAGQAGADNGQLEEGKAKTLAAERNLKKAQKCVKKASVDLLVAMGRDDIETILEVDKQQALFPEKVIKKPDYDSLVTTIPKFLIAQYEFEMDKVKKRVAPSAWLLPSVDFTGGYSPKIGSKDSKWVTNFKDGKWTGGISFSYNFTDFIKRYYNSKIDSNSFQVKSSKFLETVDSLKKGAEKHYDALFGAYESMETAKNDLELLELRWEFAQKKYINGVLEYDEWRLADNAYVDAQKKLWDCKKNVALKVAEWCNFTCDDLTKDREE